MDRTYNVLFLCTGNSARSIMAEASLNRWGKDRFRAYCAGSHPLGRVHPLTLDLLRDLHYSTDGFRSKGWEEFERPDSPQLDFVFTVCGKAASETCPVWPGQPMTAHWGVEDPVGFEGSNEQRRACFYRVYLTLENRIRIFTSLRLDDLDALALRRHLDDIGHIGS
jgi:arsenate reductase